MNEDLALIQKTLIKLLSDFVPPLKVNVNTKTNFQVTGTKEAIQGKQKVSGYYFASIVPKPKDIRLYYFPIYTHADEFADISPELRKCLKGKSCFHIKKMDKALEKEIKKMITKGVKLYKKDGVI